MLAKGKRRILQSGDWLTAQDLSDLAELDATNYYLIDEWRRSGQIFAIEHEGTEYYPSYGFDSAAGYMPQAVLAEVIATLAPKKTEWGLAFWFGSSNSYLGGRLPKDVLRDEPAMVLEAATDEIGGMHF